VNIASYTPPKSGTSQFGMANYHDADGNICNGCNKYPSTVPADVPVKQFSQVPVCSVKIRGRSATLNLATKFSQ
jgi:hypothetical protein